MRIATFNVQNLRLRHSAGISLLDAAQDRPNEEIDRLLPAERVHDRQLTAQVIARSKADLIMLQEVFDRETLDFFHDQFLVPLDATYPYRACLEGNDGRSEDLAVLSRQPLQQIISHAAMTYDEIGYTPPVGEMGTSRIFRRDCLAVLCNSIWFFGCHFKVANSGLARDRTIRRAEALAVRRIIETEFADTSQADWLTLGDFNAHGSEDEEDIQILLEPFSVDLTRDMADAEHWTYRQQESGARSCPDRILCSPAMKERRIASAPAAVRIGLPKLEDIDADAATAARSPRASDHALLWIDVA